MNKFLFSQLQDLTSFAPSRREGIESVCSIPPELGKPKKLSIRNGKLVLETDTGQHMILHKPKAP